MEIKKHSFVQMFLSWLSHSDHCLFLNLSIILGWILSARAFSEERLLIWLLFVIQQFLNFCLLSISSHVQWQIMTSHRKLRLSVCQLSSCSVCQSVSCSVCQLVSQIVSQLLSLPLFSAFSSTIANYI